MNAELLDVDTLPLQIAYQPVIKFDANTPQIVAYEALLRIGENPHGHSTYTVITQAENDGSMPKVDLRVSGLVIADVIANPDIRVWVNLSQLTLQCPKSISQLVSSLRTHNLEGRISLEITESANGDIGRITASLEQLHAHSINALIDDIDDGNPKAKLLATPLVSGVKLSRQTTARIAVDTEYRQYIVNFVATCQLLGKYVVIEGVETAEELVVARGTGADLFQGYYFCKPVPLKQALTAHENLI